MLFACCTVQSWLNQRAVTVGNGRSKAALQVADIPGTVCNKDDDVLNKKGVLEDITLLLPIGAFNIFSLCKMQKLGWSMGGDRSSTWIQNKHKKISFDIVTPTPNGGLHGMHVKRGSRDTQERRPWPGSQQALTLFRRQPRRWALN
jgi:hypothetical protein